MLLPRSIRVRLSSSVSLVLGVSALACAGQQNRAAHATLSPPDEIRRVAALIEKNHVTAVDGRGLLRVAAQALDGEAGAAPGAVPSEDPTAALNGAVARLSAARPDVDSGRVVGIAVKAMAESLNDSSRYVGPEEFRKSFRTPSTPAELNGAVGLVLKHGDPHPTVLRVLPGSPAAVAGVEAGVELRAVEERTTAGLSPDEAANLLRGPIGSRVTLMLAKHGEASYARIVQRAEVDTGPVDCRIIDGHILYLGVRGLVPRTADRVRGFANAPGEPARLVILDLRGNSGGHLDGARELADTFLASGTILSIEGRIMPAREKQEAKPGTSPLERARLAVLVDAETGSGAESVAAAIQDNGRGTIIGTHTAAKSSIDVLYELMGGGVMRLAIARMYRPNGDPIDGRGISPDVSIDAQPSAPERAFADAACPGFASPASVAKDPGIIRATSLLLAH